MSDQDYGVLLHDANDVLPLGLAGTPWEIIYNALRDVLKSGVGASDSDFMRKACALYFLARGDLDAVTDRGVLNGIAAALAVPYWVENFDNHKQASAIIYHWINYLPTRANLTALALASGMRAFKLREIYTSTEYGLSHTFGFDLGEGYETSFFAGPDAEPGLATAQRICGALTHFFLRIKDAPTLITDITYPSAAPSGWQYFFRADQSEIRILQGYNWDLYDADGNLAHLPDEYAVVEPVAVRDTYGTNTAISGSTHLITLDDGQMRISWGQSPVNAYALFANVSIDIPGMFQTWPSLDHVDVNLPPNAIPGSPLFDGMGDRIFGQGWSIFAAYDSNLNRIDINDIYLAGGSDMYDPVYLRARRYLTVCQVWLSYTPPPPPPIPEDTSFIIVDETTGNVEYYISDEGMVFSQVGHIEMPDSEMIICYETGVPVQSFYFTTNGRNETQNTNISHTDIPVYLEDGTAPAADTPYDGSSVLAFMDVEGNTKQAQGEGLYVNDGVLRLDAPDTDEGEQWAALVEYIPEVVLKVKWGDTVNVPSGYKAVEVRTFVGYAFKSYFGDFSGDSSKIVAFPGKNVYFDNIPGHEMLSARTYSNDPTSKWPLVEVFQTTGQHLVGKYLTVGYKNSVPEWPTQDRLTNGIDSTAGEYSVYLRGNNTTAIINAINSSYPVRYLWFIIDDQGNAVWHKTPEAFRVPNSLWSFVNGVFSWLGNSEDTSSLAWYYKHDWELFEWEEFDGVWLYVHCVHDPTPEPPAPPELTAYFTSLGASETEDTFITNSLSVTLRDSSGVPIPYDTSKTYTKILLYKYDGTEMSPDGVTALDSDQGWCDTVLKVRANGNKYVYKLTYTVS